MVPRPHVLQIGAVKLAGRDITKDVVSAYMWFSLAADAGNLSDRRTLLELQSNMAREEVLQGQLDLSPINSTSCSQLG